MYDKDEHDRQPDEQPTLFRVLRMQKRRSTRVIRHIQDEQGQTQPASLRIMRVFMTHFRQKYDVIEVDDDCINALADAIPQPTDTTYTEHLERPIDVDEIRQAVMAGKRQKVPESDGFGLDFYKLHWTTIKDDLCAVLNQMFLHKAITPQQKHGVVVCLPKHDTAQTPADCRPITLLNDYYKLLARILARRLRPLLANYLWKTQYCGVPGNSILYALATVRDAVAWSEVTRTPLCVLSLDFREAFDRVAHRYLFTILRAYGMHDCFVDRIQHLYQDATSSVQINGHIAGTLPLRCSVRQGCPLSMATFALCVNPLLQYLDTHLQGIRLGRNGCRTAIVAYVDDVTIFVTKHDDFRIVRDAIQL
jgi:hypothetical protein